MLIAQLTDLHLRPRGQPAYRVSETNMLVERAFETLAALRPAPDVVLITGDLTDNGQSAEYEVLQTLLVRLPMPVLMIPGNHDRRDVMRTVLGTRLPVPAQSEFLQFVIDDGPVRLIGLDSLIPGASASAGALCAARLAFLEDALAFAPERPTVVFVHHPPFDCGIGHMDEIRLIEGAAELETILSRHRQVQRLLCGHVHRSIVTRFGGTIASVAPSVAHQVAFDFRNGRPGGLVLEPPAFQLHWWSDDRIVSHTVYVERYPGPFPFVLDPSYPGGPIGAEPDA